MTPKNVPHKESAHNNLPPVDALFISLKMRGIYGLRIGLSMLFRPVIFDQEGNEITVWKGGEIVYLEPDITLKT